MMKDNMHLLDVVALTEDIPEKGLRRGQVGTIVEVLGPEVFEIEFSDEEGRAYAMLAFTCRATDTSALSTHGSSLRNVAL
jgi:Domain of unknown function (DUF4926)